jgi:two-component system response regulator VicR
MESENIKILAVDDDLDFLGLVDDVLELEGYQVIHATTAKQAIKLVKEHNPSLVLLDIMLPDADGYTVCKQIRNSSSIPVIMVTGKVTTEEKIIGLDAGADDYITKPFFPGEFCARVRAALRRNPFSDSIRPFEIEDLKIDYKLRSVALGGQNVELSITEYRLLAFLAQNVNRKVSAEEMLAEVWGPDAHDPHLVTVTIGRIRQKLDDVERLKYIQNKPGKGYVIHAN